MKNESPFREEKQEQRGKLQLKKCSQQLKNRKNPAVLFKWVKDHLSHPYPTSVEKEQLLRQARMNRRQLDHWFGNERRSIKKLKLPVWLKKHSTFSADPGVLPYIRSVHDNFPHSVPTSCLVNQPAMNGINSQLPHFTIPPPPLVLPPPPPLTPHIGISSEGGERECGPTCTSIDQHAAFSVGNGYQHYHAFYPYQGSIEHPSHGAGTHSAVMAERYTTTHQTSQAPCAPQKLMMPSSSFNSFTSSSCPQPAYKVVSNGHSPYPADVLLTPSQHLDIENGPRADSRLQSYLFIPPLKAKDELLNGDRAEASCKLSLYPSSGTSVTNVNDWTREEWWGRCVSSAGGGNGRWEVGARAKEEEECAVKEEPVGALKKCFGSSEHSNIISKNNEATCTVMDNTYPTGLE